MKTSIKLIALIPLVLFSAPNKPSNLTLKPTTNSIKLSWGDNSYDEKGFKIYRNNKFIDYVTSNTTSYIDRGLKPNTKYSYTLKSSDDLFFEVDGKVAHKDHVIVFIDADNNSDTGYTKSDIVGADILLQSGTIYKRKAQSTKWSDWESIGTTSIVQNGNRLFYTFDRSKLDGISIDGSSKTKAFLYNDNYSSKTLLQSNNNLLDSSSMEFKLSSDDFTQGKNRLSKIPDLRWGVVIDAKEYAIIIDDHDANNWVHWNLFHLDRYSNSTVKGVIPNEATVGKNELGSNSYIAAAHPDDHEYVTHIYALNKKINPNSNKHYTHQSFESEFGNSIIQKASLSSYDNKKIAKTKKIFIIGPSTVRLENDINNPLSGCKENKGEMGWGDTISSYLKDPNSAINMARAGAGALAYNMSYNEGINQNISPFLYGSNKNRYWEKTKEMMAKNSDVGGFLLIQFGNGNDNATYQELYKDVVDRATKREKIKERFKEDLKPYVDAARSLNYIPIFITAVNGRTFSQNDKMENNRGYYPQTMKDLAKDLGVRVLDLNAKSIKEYSRYSEVELREKFSSCKFNGIYETIHFEPRGAKIVSGWIRDLACEDSNSKLCKEFK